jgi:hypothetical protein
MSLSFNLIRGNLQTVIFDKENNGIDGHLPMTGALAHPSNSHQALPHIVQQTNILG